MAVDRRIAQRQKRMKEAGYQPALASYNFNSNIPIRQQSSPRPLTTVDNPLPTSEYRKMVHNATVPIRQLSEANTIESRKMINDGMNWYPRERERLTKNSGVDDETILSIASALSPRVDWHDFVVPAARAFVKTGRQGNRGLPDNWAKAHRIRNGEDPITVLGKGLKTVNFYHNLNNPDNPKPLTVDTHTANQTLGWLAVGIDDDLEVKEEIKISSIGAYNTLADANRMAFTRVGQHYGLTVPNQLQAINWVAWKAMDHQSPVNRQKK